MTWLWRQDPLVLLLLLIVLLVAAGWLFQAVLRVLQQARFGEVTLSVADPVSPGGKLTAVLRTGFGKARHVTAGLQCTRAAWRDEFMTGYGRGERLPEEKLVWSRTARFPVIEEAGVWLCRIEFAVPEDAEPTRPHKYDYADRQVKLQWQTPGFRWHLDVRIDMGVGLQRNFVIDVVPAPPGKMAA